MSNINELKPVDRVQDIINRFCYTIGMIPSSYKISLTYEEQILAIGKYLEETVIPAINNNAECVVELQNLYIDLKNYVDNYFENLDVQDEINNKLDAMVEAGTMAEIINQEIFGELNQKVDDNYNTLDGKIDDLENDINAEIDEINKKINIASFNELNLKRLSRELISVNAEYHHLQGCVKTENNVVVRALISDETDVNSVKIQKINITTNSIIAETIIPEGGHANWIDYNPDTNEIFVTPLYIKSNGSTQNSNKITVLDYTTLSITDSFTVNPSSQNCMSFIYDKISKKYYIYTTANNLFEYDREQNTATLLFQLNFNFTPYGQIFDEYKSLKQQGVTVHNNLIYLLSINPYAVAVLDMDNNLLQTYNINKFVNDLYLIREVEQITVGSNGDIFVSSFGHETIEGEFEMIQYFEGNIAHNTPNLQPVFNAPLQKYVYVDISSSSVNPIGTPSNPFKTIGEALDILYNKYYMTAIFKLEDGTYPFSRVINASNITIESSSEDRTKVTLNGIRLQNSKVRFHNISIQTSSYNNDKSLYSFYSDVMLRYCNLINNSNSQFIAEVSSTNLEFSELNFNGSSPDMFTNKHVIRCAYESKIYCKNNISPLYQLDGASKLLTKCRFSAPINLSLGELSLPDEFFTMISNISIQNIYFETSTRANSADNYFNHFYLFTATDMFRLKSQGTSDSSGFIATADATLDFTNKKLIVENNRNVQMTSSGNTVNVKSSSTAENDFIRITNLYFD